MYSKCRTLQVYVADVQAKLLGLDLLLSGTFFSSINPAQVLE